MCERLLRRPNYYLVAIDCHRNWGSIPTSPSLDKLHRVVTQYNLYTLTIITGVKISVTIITKTDFVSALYNFALHIT